MAHATTSQPRLWISGAGAPTTSTLATAGATYWDATNSVAYQNVGTGAAPVWVRIFGPTAEDYWKARAASLLGLAAPSMSWRWLNLGNHEGYYFSETAAGSGNYQPYNGDSGAYDNAHSGVLEVFTGATGSSSDYLCPGGAYPGSVGYNQCDLPGGATSTIWVAARLKVTTTPDAQTKLGVTSLRPSSGAKGSLFWLGVDGSVSPTNYAAFTDGGSAGTIDSGVAIDTGYHVVEYYRVGTAAAYMAVDCGTPASSASSFPSVPWGMSLGASNGTTAANQNVRVDWMAFATSVPT